jgi:hypothetical protein
MNEDIKQIKEKRISVVQAKKAVRKANPKRQYGYGAIDMFVACSTELIDLYAEIIEKSMLVAPGQGKGCRVQSRDAELIFGRMMNYLNKFENISEKATKAVLEAENDEHE